jgi:hypothetical protein
LWLRAVVLCGVLTSPGAAPPAALAAAQQTTPVTVMYAAGWNLVGASPGTVLSGLVGPLYTLQPAGSAYTTVTPETFAAESAQGSEPKAGTGYWAYFANATPVSIPFYPTMPQPGAGRGAIPFTIAAPIGQWLMIGNPYNTAVTVDGLPGVYAYVPGRGYIFTSRLEPGEGAFAYSETGASILLCPVVVTCG